MKKAVIFDFDGTIANSRYVWQKVDVDFFAKRGMEIPRDYVEAISVMSFYNGAVYTKEKYNIKESVEEIMNEWNSQALREYKENVVLKPFVKEYLRELKDRGYKIGLATAALHDYYIPVLEREGVLDCFDVFTDTRDDARDKNFPDIYLLCAEKLGSNSANSIVFEDVLKGVKSSVSAGFNTTAVYDNQPENQWEIIKNTANRHIMDFSELLHKNKRMYLNSEI
ncbi:MAG: HAD family phosphatase [Eubacterium sp.]|jgi:HAD superfamily hydrolase (TIGR01509 family)|nr:HAD family phosphatase [Eubacterium sp.]